MAWPQMPSLTTLQYPSPLDVKWMFVGISSDGVAALNAVGSPSPPDWAGCCSSRLAQFARNLFPPNRPCSALWTALNEPMASPAINAFLKIYFGLIHMWKPHSLIRAILSAGRALPSLSSVASQPEDLNNFVWSKQDYLAFLPSTATGTAATCKIQVQTVPKPLGPVQPPPPPQGGQQQPPPPPPVGNPIAWMRLINARRESRDKMQEFRLISFFSGQEWARNECVPITGNSSL